jgi:hypothetical protein
MLERLTCSIVGHVQSGRLVYGSDGHVDEHTDSDFTAEERAEIAEHFIARWRKWERGE